LTYAESGRPTPQNGDSYSIRCDGKTVTGVREREEREINIYRERRRDRERERQMEGGK
jgi:hypothetical protein